MVLAPRRSHGQDVARGFWVAVGLASGFDRDGADPQVVPIPHVRAGGTLSEQVRLGGELMFWRIPQVETDITRANALLSATVFPFGPRGTFFVRGGLGVGTIRFERGCVAMEGVTCPPRIWRLAAGAGAGFELPLGSHVFVAPGLDWALQAFTGHRLRARNQLFMLSLSLVWR